MMTIITQEIRLGRTATAGRTTVAAPPIQWKLIQPGLWIAKQSGEFAGMIESVADGGFSAMTSRGRHLGVFPTATEAKQSFTR